MYFIGCGPADELTSNPLVQQRTVRGLAKSEDSTITNGIITLTFDGVSGRLKTYANAATGVNQPLTQVLNGVI